MNTLVMYQPPILSVRQHQYILKKSYARKTQVFNTYRPICLSLTITTTSKFGFLFSVVPNQSHFSSWLRVSLGSTFKVNLSKAKDTNTLHL